MQASCKMSHSVLLYLEKQGIQTEPFEDNPDGNETPIEFFKDPSFWIPMSRMESFFSQMAEFTNSTDTSKFLREVGRSNVHLGAWGVLDSVLKMVESPRDIFYQPQRFMSYFFSPQPEIQMTQQGKNSIDFSLSQSRVSPLVTSYFIGAVEGLPQYMDFPLASIDRLANSRYRLSWTQESSSLFGEKERKRRQLRPEIVHSVMQGLEDQHRSLGLSSSEQGGSSFISSGSSSDLKKEQVKGRHEIEKVLMDLKNDFHRMKDYFVRAQQLVTIISPLTRRSLIKEAMHRVDWPRTQEEFSRVAERACKSASSIQDQVDELLGWNEGESSLQDTQKVNINELLEKVIEKLPLRSKELKVDKHWLFDQEVSVEPQKFSQAMDEILRISLSQSQKNGELRIMTRPNGSKVEIEVTDTGTGFTEDSLEKVFNRDHAQSLEESCRTIRRHRGCISISSQRGAGSTYLIELPI